MITVSLIFVVVVIVVVVFKRPEDMRSHGIDDMICLSFPNSLPLTNRVLSF